MYRDHHPATCNRLIFALYPDGRVVEPVQGKPGQYFGRPIFCGGSIYILLIDFPDGRIRIIQYDDACQTVVPVALLPLTEVEDCYNLLLHQTPLMLTRQANDGKFQIIWPESFAFAIGETESFCFRKDDQLYFSRWDEQMEGQIYQEEVVVRRYPDGSILDVIPGAWMEMPDGQIWLLR